MPRLRDRNKQSPGGHFFYQPETRFRTAEWSSFHSIVDQVIAHRQGNPAMTAKHNWSLDRATVENEVDNFIANVCVQMGWQNFVVGTDGGAPLPKMNPPSQQEVSNLVAAGAKARMIWAGVKTLNAWLDSGEPGVAKEVAEQRAATCIACPLNTTGGFESWFTKPAAAVVHKQMEKLSAMKLSTSVDDKLNLCSACLCPLKLKAWTPMKFIKPNMTDETMDKLRGGKDCWILAELKA